MGDPFNDPRWRRKAGLTLANLMNKMERAPTGVVDSTPKETPKAAPASSRKLDPALEQLVAERAGEVAAKAAAAAVEAVLAKQAREAEGSDE